MRGPLSPTLTLPTAPLAVGGAVGVWRPRHGVLARGLRYS